jgi:hypothetical protein
MATDPRSPDALNFTSGHQPLVDAAFLAHAIVRAPGHLWTPLEPKTRANLVTCLKATRTIPPAWNNWLLFSAMIEAALRIMGESDWDRMRIDYALRQHEQWYVGDGVYGDGPKFHWDYYNSFVIQPMLLDVLGAVGGVSRQWDAMREPMVRRAQRYAAVIERLVSPEGTLPPLGRSLAYRFGSLQMLGQAALQHILPPDLKPAQVRCAMSAVIRRMVSAPGTFDERGWLRIGLCGHQPGLAEGYISTGSLYLCATGLLPLGLDPHDVFWSSPAEDWTARQLWSGHDPEAPDQAM